MTDLAAFSTASSDQEDEVSMQRQETESKPPGTSVRPDTLRRALPAKARKSKAFLNWNYGTAGLKMPHYSGGGVREGTQNSPADLAKLVPFEEAVVKSTTGWGLALAPRPELNLFVLDVDKNATPEVLALADDCEKLTYTETSPSGQGRRIIFSGQAATRHNNAIGFEVFGSNGFVTLTGAVLNELKVTPIPEDIATRADALLRTRKSSEPITATRIPKGERHADMRRVAARLANDGLTESTIVAALVARAQELYDDLDDVTEPIELHATKIAQWAASNPAGAEFELAGEAELFPMPEHAKLDQVQLGGFFELAMKMQDVAYVMKPILIQGQLILLTARPGHGKSTIAAAIAFALGLQCEFGICTPLVEGLVYFVSAEDVDGTRKRIFAEGLRHNITNDQRAKLDERLRWLQVPMMSPEVINGLIEKDARGRSVIAVFVDTGPALFARDDENANAQMQGFAASCQTMTELPGRPCVVVFWHPVKNATADNLEPRGASSLIGTIDGNLTIWLDGDIATLSCTKWRGEYFDPMLFGLEVVDLFLPSGATTSIKIATPKTAAQIEGKQTEITERREKVLSVLLKVGGLATRELAIKVGASQRTVNRDLQDMAKGKPALVVMDVVTERYVLTAQGSVTAKRIGERDSAAFLADLA